MVAVWTVLTMHTVTVDFYLLALNVRQVNVYIITVSMIVFCNKVALYSGQCPWQIVSIPTSYRLNYCLALVNIVHHTKRSPLMTLDFIKDGR